MFLIEEESSIVKEKNQYIIFLKRERESEVSKVFSFVDTEKI